MLICTPNQAMDIYEKVLDAARAKAVDLNMPEDNEDYQAFKKSHFTGKRDRLSSGCFRTAYRVRGYVLKVPQSWAGARQNIIEHYAAMSDLPFTPRGTMLIIHNFGCYDIPVLAVPYQDLSIRDRNSEAWKAIRPYNYTGDWAQYGKAPSGKAVLTDWALIDEDRDVARSSASSNTTKNKLSCGCGTCDGVQCDCCERLACIDCRIERCSKCSNRHCNECSCQHCTNSICDTSRCNGCRSIEDETSK